MKREQLAVELLNFLHKKAKLGVNNYYASLVYQSKYQSWGAKLILNQTRSKK